MQYLVNFFWEEEEAFVIFEFFVFTVVGPNLLPNRVRTVFRFFYRTVFYRDRDRYRTVF